MIQKLTIVSRDTFGENTVFHQKILTPTIKHSDGNVMAWGYAVSGPGQFSITESTMNSFL